MLRFVAVPVEDNNMRFLQGFRSALIYCRSGSSIFSHCGSGSSFGSRVLMAKNGKKITAEKMSLFIYFFFLWGSFFSSMIWIQQLQIKRIHADPDSKPCFFLNSK
jgi:hypothetical protein